MRRIIILGSTGSIGEEALALVRHHPSQFQVVGLAAGTGHERLREQAEEFNVEHTALGASEASAMVREVPADVVLNAIRGSEGLEPTLAALAAGRRLALANRESLIVGGDLVIEAAEPDQIVHIAPEHAAVAQALRAGTRSEVSRLILTASGGPFRGRTRAQLQSVTPEQALANPAWSSGQVVTTNSATLVNKGLEIIESHLLFGVSYGAIEVVVHPQSTVHSMVEFIDGSTILQASPRDVKLPIALGLSWPERISGVGQPLDWRSATSWEFEPLDEEVFPAVAIAREVGRARKTYPAVYNAANGEAVQAFHDRRIGFLDIVDIVQEVLEGHSAPEELTLEALAEAEVWARTRTQSVIAARS